MAEATQDKATDVAIQDATRMKEQSKQLPGKTVVLGPRAAFFTDTDRQYVLNAYGTIGDKKSENDHDRVVVQKNWKLFATMVAIKNNLLRVLDEKGKDVTSDFGGSATPDTGVSMPIVSDVSKRADPKDDPRDKKLMELLANNNEDAVMKSISSRSPSYDALERLLQLEIAGENPSFAPRGKVIDGLKELIKNTTGIGMAGKIEDDDERVITTKKS